ncbi:MAG TPA: hypothetical protein VLL52_01645 [Anaerolineae bacterium]|nr:hypothetical protein [Anaerolineae bacterium]
MDKMDKKAFNYDYLILFIISGLIQAIWVALTPEPAYMDAHYYTLNGRLLANTHAFTEPIIWQYLDNPTTLPTPSHSYWPPLASILAALGYTLNNSFRAAQLPFWLLTSTLPLLSYYISHRLGGQRWQNITAALFTTAGGFYANSWNQPETFAPFAWLGALIILNLGHPRHYRHWLTIGLLTGLAHLTRADGILFLGLAGLIALGNALNWQRPNLPQLHDQLRPLTLNILALFAGYLIITAGWFWRNWQTLGYPLPIAGTQTIFLTNYNDIFAYGRQFTLDSYLAWGWDNILSSKIQAINFSILNFIAINGLIFLTPFLLIGLVTNSRRHPAYLRPLILYTIFLYTAMSLVFTFPGQRGGLFHSSIALHAWFMPLAASGIGSTIDTIASRLLSHWQPARAKPIFAALFILIAFSLSFGRLFVPSTVIITPPSTYQAAADQLPSDAVVFVGNAPGFSYYTHLAALSIPNEPLDTLLTVADRYGATHLLIDHNHPRPLKPFYNGEESSPRLQEINSWQEAHLYQILPAATAVPAPSTPNTD